MSVLEACSIATVGKLNQFLNSNKTLSTATVAVLLAIVLGKPMQTLAQFDLDFDQVSLSQPVLRNSEALFLSI